MANRGRSEPNLFGGYTHYDEKGHKLGRSDPGLFGGYINYDAKGHVVGRSDPSLFGGYTHYDSKGHKTGHSDLGLFGSYMHFDNMNRQTGRSDPGFFGYHNSNGQGCYIATCVYGSYDCPEVWALRRFRDNILGRCAAGLAFIRCYYAVSPALVRRFGGALWFRRFWRGRLDRLVGKLRAGGVADTPYRDRDWR